MGVCVGAMPVKIFYSPQSGLLLKPIKINQYFIVKQGWSIWGIVRNPMVRSYHGFTCM